MIKRATDFGIALLALMVLSPLLFGLWLSVQVVLGKPAIFKQRRPGLHGKPFVMYKFRTMSSERDAKNKYLPDEKRLGRFGSALRKTSLDELPELWNVVKGDMSLVGPRPLLMEYLPLYDDFQNRRHEVRPGLTGWAQVNGRNNISWQDKFEMDVWYVDNRSLRLDLKIMLMTIGKLCKADGVAKAGHATSDFFRGND